MQSTWRSSWPRRPSASAGFVPAHRRSAGRSRWPPSPSTMVSRGLSTSNTSTSDSTPTSDKEMHMAFHLDLGKIQWPPPGSFEANILRTIEVPYQTIDISGGQYPPPHPLEGITVPAFRINWQQV